MRRGGYAPDRASRPKGLGLGKAFRAGSSAFLPASSPPLRSCDQLGHSHMPACWEKLVSGRARHNSSIGMGSQHICASGSTDCPPLWIQITQLLTSPTRLSPQQGQTLETDPENLAKALPERNSALALLDESRNFRVPASRAKCIQRRGTITSQI